MVHNDEVLIIYRLPYLTYCLIEKHDDSTTGIYLNRCLNISHDPQALTLLH